MIRRLSILIAGLIALPASAATIQLEAKTYNGFPNGNTLSDITYIGQPGTIVNLAPDASIGNKGAHIVGDNVTIAGVTLTGAGIFIDKSSGYNTNINLIADKFQTTISECVNWSSGLKDSNILGCSFTGPSYCLYGYNYTHLTIANNECANSVSGFHIDAFGNSGNLLVEQNYLHGIQRMNMEFQGTADGDVFQDNWVENPNLSSVFAVNNDSMLYSLILAKSQNVTICHNVAINTSKPDGTGSRIGFEVGGDNTLVENNYCQNTNDSFTVNDGDGSCSVTIRNNRIIGPKMPQISFPAANRTMTATNNGPAVATDIDLMARGRPSRTKRFDGSAAVDARFINTDVMPQSVTPPAFSVSAVILPIINTDGSGSIVFTFTNPPAGIAQVKVEAVAAQGVTDPRGIFSRTVAYTNPLTLTGQTPGYQEAYTLTALNAAGASVGTAKITPPQSFPGSSTIPWPPVLTTQPTDNPTIAALQQQLAAAKVTIDALNAKVAELTAGNATLIAKVKAAIGL